MRGTTRYTMIWRTFGLAALSLGAITSLSTPLN